MTVDRNQQHDAPLLCQPAGTASDIEGGVGRHFGDAYRRRLLVVGQSAAAAVRQAAARPVTVLPSIYDALGELAVTDLKAAPDAVICSIDALGSDTVDFTAAVRRLDPSVSLIIVTDTDQERAASDALADGFDSYVLTPLTTLQLERAINEAGRIASYADADDFDLEGSRMERTPTAPHTAAEPVEEPTEPPVPAPQMVAEVVAADCEPGPESAPAEDTSEYMDDDETQNPQLAGPASKYPGLKVPIDASDLIDKVPAESPAQPNPTLKITPPIPAPSARFAQPSPSAAGTPTVAPWSDRELVDALLNQPESLPDVALARIQAELGSTSIKHVKDASVLRAGSQQQLAIAVTSDHESFGHLVAHGSDFTHPDCIAQLTKAASWLGAWLRLHARVTRLREMAYTDDLTGIGNRRFFDSFLGTAVTQARKRRQFLTLLVFDIDNFKTYNDRYGHSAGDEILIETARLMNSVVRPCDKVCRLGGDEFGVIFYDPTGSRHGAVRHPEDIEQIAHRFQNQIRRHKFPKLGGQAPGPLTISAGLASFPWDGHSPKELYEHADKAACRAKASGKNAIIFGPHVVDPVDSGADDFAAEPFDDE